MGEFNTEFAMAADSVSQKEEEGSGAKSFGGAGGFYSTSGNVKLATDGYTPEFTDTNMEESTNGYFIHSPIHEFFAKMGGKTFASSGLPAADNWFKYYGSPHDKSGEGSTGTSHQGIDINIFGGERGKTPVYATTDGILVIHQPEALAQGGGNYVEWTDNDGMHHRIMHLDHFSEEMENMRPGDQVIGGKTLLGYYGSTGNSTGDHIHYDISPNGYASSEWYNPLTYFNFKPAATDGDSSYIAGDTLDEQMWQWLRFKGMKLPESSVAGIMGVWKAEGVQPRMIEGAYSEPETSLAEPIYDAIVGDPDNNTAGLQKLWDYTPAHAAGKNGGYLPNYMYNGHPWAGIGLAQWTAGRTYKLLKHAWDNYLNYGTLKKNLKPLIQKLVMNLLLVRDIVQKKWLRCSGEISKDIRGEAKPTTINVETTPEMFMTDSKERQKLMLPILVLSIQMLMHILLEILIQFRVRVQVLHPHHQSLDIQEMVILLKAVMYQITMQQVLHITIICMRMHMLEMIVHVRIQVGQTMLTKGTNVSTRMRLLWEIQRVSISIMKTRVKMWHISLQLIKSVITGLTKASLINHPSL